MNNQELNIVSYNLNGIRSAISKGLADWIKATNYELYLFQEIKADLYSIPVEYFDDLGYDYFWNPAQKKGYSGVGVLYKKGIEVKNIKQGFGIPFYDNEGRVLQFEIGDITFLNTYFPSGSSGDERQAVKMNFLDDYFNYINDLKKSNPNIIISGDYNICHNEIDIHDPKGNKNSSGFLPEEREWMSKFFNSGFVDTFRYINNDVKDQYSWWSFRAGARAKNKGWRIDYHACTTSLASQILDAKIFMDVKHSDHCPIYLKLKK